MTTIRVNRRQRFTVVDREAINDERLSFRARGILFWLLDKPDDWRCNSDDIAAACIEGRDAVRTALRELQALDYIVRRREQDRETGQWRTVTDVYETPQQAADDGIPGVGNPDVGNPDVGSPDVGAPGPIPKTETEDCERREDPPTPPKGAALDVQGSVDSAVVDFSLFWEHYPRKVGRPVALKAYVKAMRKASFGEIRDGLKRWLEYWERRNEPEYIPHASTWLNQERWNDVPPPLPKAKDAGLSSGARALQDYMARNGS